MAIPLHHRRISLLMLMLICSVALTASAQQPHSPQMPAPPPMRVVSRDERSQLTAAKDPKSRIRTTVELAEDHLKRAEDSTSQKQFDHAAEELGRYLGLIDDARQFLSGMNRDKNSTRDLYRHFEIALRKHVPRLAVMRRTTPVDYADNIKAAEEYVRNTRSEALESFYGHSVLREGANNEKKPDGAKDPPEGNKRP